MKYSSKEWLVKPGEYLRGGWCDAYVLDLCLCCHFNRLEPHYHFKRLHSNPPLTTTWTSKITLEADLRTGYVKRICPTFVGCKEAP